MISDSLAKKFEDIVGKENVFTNEADLQKYAYRSNDASPCVPAAVVRPTSTEQLGPIISLCYNEGLPMTARGSGSSVVGNAAPVNTDTVVILTEALNRIIEINTEDLYAKVEPGVVTSELTAKLKELGLFFPPDPGPKSKSTIGGNVAENSGGLRSLKYGTTKDYVMGMEFYANTGDFVRSGSRCVKCATGYFMHPLMVGSEGTLGIFSQLTLKLVPPPKASKAILAVYNDAQTAAKSAFAVVSSGLVPCTMQFLDKATIGYLEAATKPGLPADAGAILMVEVDGHPDQVVDDYAAVEKVLKDSGCAEIIELADADKKLNIWEARRTAVKTLAAIKPSFVMEEINVLRSKIPSLIAGLEKIAKDRKVAMAVFGHIGEGHLQACILCDKNDKDEWARTEKAADDMVNLTISLGGRLSGSQVIGIAKKQWLEKETANGSIMLSRRLRNALDPKGLFNPDKVVGA